MRRVLIVHRSAATRDALRAGLCGCGLDAAGEAADGVEAVRLTCKLRPDLVVIGENLPRIDGVEAIRRIMRDCPTPIVIVREAGAAPSKETADMLAAGALAVASLPAEGAAAAAELAQLAVAMTDVKLVRRRLNQPAPPAAVPALDAATVTRIAGRVRAIGLAASTGGPAALQSVLSALPANFPTPILIVQHIAAGYVGGLAQSLVRATPLAVRVAEHNETLERSTVYLAPDEHHLGVSRHLRIELSDAPPICGFRPSATHLFRSLAASFGAAALGVVLTGMGEDGLDGLAALKREGGGIIAQDEASSVVFGMPGAAVRAGLADRVLPLSQIAEELVILAASRTG